MTDVATEGLRTCYRCKAIKPLYSFYANNRDRVHGRASECKDCTKKRAAVGMRQLRERNPEKVKQYSRDYQRRLKAASFGLTVDQLREMEERQQGVCAICKQPETLTYRDRVRALALDHDHETGAVRALLCANCNRGLGYFKDNPELMRAAADYLVQHKEARR